MGNLFSLSCHKSQHSVVLFSLFRPVNGGDANIMRFEPIWMARAEAGVVEVVESVDGVDLTTETDNDYPRFLGPRQNATIIGLNLDPDRVADIGCQEQAGSRKIMGFDQGWQSVAR